MIITRKFAEGDKVVTDSIDIVTKSVVKYMIKSGRKLCTAESCTGGMISQTITSVSGASEMFLGGACTYTEEIKTVSYTHLTLPTKA